MIEIWLATFVVQYSSNLTISFTVSEAWIDIVASSRRPSQCSHMKQWCPSLTSNEKCESSSSFESQLHLSCPPMRMASVRSSCEQPSILWAMKTSKCVANGQSDAVLKQ